MCHETPYGLRTPWDLDPQSDKFRPRQKMRHFENMVMSYYQRIRPQFRSISFYTTGTQKAVDCFSVTCSASTASLYLKPWGVIIFTVPVRKHIFLLTDDEIQRGNKKKMNESRRNSFLEQGHTVMEMYECEWWHHYKSNDIVKQHLSESFTPSSIDPYLVRSSVILKFIQEAAKTLPSFPNL